MEHQARRVGLEGGPSASEVGLEIETLCFDGLLAVNSVLQFMQRRMTAAESGAVLAAVADVAKRFPPPSEAVVTSARYRSDEEWLGAFREFGHLLTGKKFDLRADK